MNGHAGACQCGQILHARHDEFGSDQMQNRSAQIPIHHYRFQTPKIPPCVDPVAGRVVTLSDGVALGMYQALIEYNAVQALVDVAYRAWDPEAGAGAEAVLLGTAAPYAEAGAGAGSLCLKLLVVVVEVEAVEEAADPDEAVQGVLRERAPELAHPWAHLAAAFALVAAADVDVPVDVP